MRARVFRLRCKHYVSSASSVLRVQNAGRISNYCSRTFSSNSLWLDFCFPFCPGTALFASNKWRARAQKLPVARGAPLIISPWVSPWKFNKASVWAQGNRCRPPPPLFRTHTTAYTRSTHRSNENAPPQRYELETSLGKSSTRWVFAEMGHP